MKAIMNNVESIKIITTFDIAKEVGFSQRTVTNILGSDNPRKLYHYKSETIDLIRKTAEKMGYDPAFARGKGFREMYLTPKRFSSHEEETKYMLYLRTEFAMTNAEIAKKVGVCYLTVLHRIGPQPKELTKMSHILKGERIVRRNQARRQVLLSQKITKFEQFQREMSEIDARAAQLESEAQRISNEAKAIRDQYSIKVVELNQYRTEAEKAAKELGRSLA